MRKSVERRREAELRYRVHPHGLRRYRLVITLVVLFTAVTACMIGYLDWKERSDATAQKAEQVRQFALIDTRVKAALQKKIDDAKKAEADAKARAEADAEAQKATACRTSCRHDIIDSSV